MLTTALLIAQLAAPYCGWNYGVEITPQNAPFTGCYVPPPPGQQHGGTILREDPLSPGGVRAYPARGEWQTF
jgi:hypothetical protein